MCATACPAFAIHIEATEREGSTEKMPAVFNVDELRCVDCGLCVEACPCDAIRMDTGVHPAPSTTREATMFNKKELLELNGLNDGNLPKTARTSERRKV
jgi:NADH-quinone oxidoreductase subunit I